jgi:hypothetical protein
LDASGISGLGIDNLLLTWLRAAASTQTLCASKHEFRKERGMKPDLCLRLLLIVLIGSSSVLAQESSQANNLRFEEVTRGMPQQTVIDRLAKHYRLEKVDLKSDELDMRVVHDQTDLPIGQIFFQSGKVSAVVTYKLPPLTGDAVKLGREIFSALYFEADAPKAPSDIDKFLGTRNVVLNATLDRTQTRDFDEQRIMFDVGKIRYRIIITLPVQSNAPASVRMDTVR